MIHKLYVILTISLICSNSVFSQEPTKKIAFDFYFSPTLSQTKNDFPTNTYYNNIPYFTIEKENRINLFLTNFGFTINFENPKRLTFGFGLALLKRGGREEYNLIPTSPVFSAFFIDSSSTYKESNTTWYYNCLDFPISVDYLLSQTPRWTKSIKASMSISYVINFKAKSKGVFFNDSTFNNKVKWDINPPFKDRLGFSFEFGYRLKSVFVNKTSFWFEPYINCLISSTREIMSECYLNVGIHLGIQIY